MATAQRFVIRSNSAGGTNKFLIYSNSADAVPIGFSSQQPQQAAADLVQSALIAITSRQQQQTAQNLITWAYTVLVAPIYLGPGSIFYNGNFTGSPPQPGDIVAYDPTYIIVNTDGTVSSSQYTTAQAMYNDGTGWVAFTITVAAWNVNPTQLQQSAMDFDAAALIAITAQQGQQITVAVAPVVGLSINPIQAQQALVNIVARALPAITARQQQQQLGMDARTSVNPSINPRQNQQELMEIGTAAQLGFAAQQAQQSNTGVAVPSPIPVAITAQQRQQAAAAIVAHQSPAMTAQQAQTATMAVLVPIPVAIGMTAQQGQQAIVAVSTAQAIAATFGQQGQQNVIEISAAMRAAFVAQQGQQSLIVLPTLGSPVIASGLNQQSQQISADIVLFPVIGAFAQQGQQADVALAPLPAQLMDLDPEGISLQLGGYLPIQQDSTKIFYIGRDNSAAIGVLYYGLPLDLGAVTQVQIELIDTPTVIDSNSSPDWMSWTPGSNVLTLRLGNVPGIESGIYPVAVVIYDYAHPNGQTIAGPGLPLLLFDFEQDRTAVA